MAAIILIFLEAGLQLRKPREYIVTQNIFYTNKKCSKKSTKINFLIQVAKFNEMYIIRDFAVALIN